MSNSGVQIIHWVDFLFTLHSPLPDSVSARSLSSAKPILVIWHRRECREDIQLSSSNCWIISVLQANTAFIILAGQLARFKIPKWMKNLNVSFCCRGWAMV